MVRMFVRHDVADFDAWKGVYEEFNETRMSMGVKDHAVYQSVENPNDVTVWHDFESAEAGQAFVSSDELRAAMERAGVRGEPQIWFASPN